MEYDHMAELGFAEETQFICSDHVFLTRSNHVRDLCARYVKNGGRLYDVLSRYDSLTLYALGRDSANAGSVNRLVVPFLKAGGITDEAAYNFCKSTSVLMPDADKVLRYIASQMPAFISSESYEHHLMNLGESMDFPLSNISCNLFSFDSIKISRPDSKAIRGIASTIINARLTDEMYSVTQSPYLNKFDSKLVDMVDDEYIKKTSKMEFNDQLRKDIRIAGNEKAYAILELCRKKEIEMGATIVVGSDESDYPALDLVRDSDGLALAFNGTEYAVRGSNVAIIDENPITVAVLSMEFYNGGIESVYDMIDHWTIDELRTRPCADRNLMNMFLAQFPERLPEVYKVDDDNLKDVTVKSAAYRKRIIV
jgi:energy-converting hydrogenase A subunit R